MPYRRGKRLFPDPADRREHLQVVNVYVQAQTNLTPLLPVPEGMFPLRAGQDVPMIGEEALYDVDPDVRDS
jgi:hypothetical protein